MLENKLKLFYDRFQQIQLVKLLKQIMQKKIILATDSIALITKKQKKFIREALAQTDKILADYKKTQQSPQRIYKNPSDHLTTTIQQHYSLLLKCYNINMNQIHRISLQSYMQDYFCLDMRLHVFPIVIEIIKISNYGVLHIGFNKQYPGVQMKSIKKLKHPLNELRLQIRQIQQIQIKSPGNLNVQKIYFMFSTQKHSLNLDFRVKISPKHLNQFRNQSLQSKFKQQKQKKNQMQLLTTNFTNFKVQKRKHRVKTQISPKFSMTKASYLMKLQTLANLNQQNVGNKFQIINPRHKTVESFYEQKQINKFLKTNASQIFKSFKQKKQFSPTKTLNNTSFMSSFLRNSINFTTQQKLKFSKQNLKQLQTKKAKSSKLNQLASQHKTQIVISKKQYDVNKLKIKKINVKLTTLLMLNKFMAKTNLLYLKRKKYFADSFKVNLYVSKFISNIKKQQKKSQTLIPQKYYRISYGLLPVTTFLGSMLYQKAEDKAQKIIVNSFKKIFNSLVIQELLRKYEIYKQKVIKIQIYYRQRFRCQILGLTKYSQEKVTKLMQKHPHLNRFQKQFKDSKVLQHLVCEYLKDQNLKHNQRIKQYRQQQRQRNMFIKFKNQNQTKDRLKQKINKGTHQKIQMSTTSKEKQKVILKSKNNIKQLQIPQKPIKPIKCIFKNLDILNTMIRNWFQLQNHIWTKKQKAKLWY